MQFQNIKCGLKNCSIDKMRLKCLLHSVYSWTHFKMPLHFEDENVCEESIKFIVSSCYDADWVAYRQKITGQNSGECVDDI